jgi:hypothetical protein
VEALEPPRSCDVVAVYSAKSARKAAGQEDTDGLTDLQKDLYNYVQLTCLLFRKKTATDYIICITIYSDFDN